MASNIGLWGRLSVLLIISFFFAACDGDNGAPGAVGPEGPQGPVGPDGPPGPVPDEIAAAIESAKVEACATCHGGVGVDEHQSVYDKYVDVSALALTINSVTSALEPAGTYAVTVDFSITDNGLPLLEGPGLASIDQKRFYMV